MARFNLDDYEDVAARLQRVYSRDFFPDARIITTLEAGDRNYCVFKCEIYKNVEELDMKLPMATGWAMELSPDEPHGNKNVTAFYENCETSAIGRAIANSQVGQIGKNRPSREEMMAVSDNAPPARSQKAQQAKQRSLAEEADAMQLKRVEPENYEDWEEVDPPAQEAPSGWGEIPADGELRALKIPSSFKCPSNACDLDTHRLRQFVGKGFAPNEANKGMLVVGCRRRQDASDQSSPWCNWEQSRDRWVEGVQQAMSKGGE
tara:strand:+ start:3971 stop:4756 length:786 start_codon:yes stop_codon:yes gene_type:complete